MPLIHLGCNCSSTQAWGPAQTMHISSGKEPVFWPAAGYDPVQPNEDQAALCRQLKTTVALADAASPAGEEDLQTRHAYTAQKLVPDDCEPTTLEIETENVSVDPFMVEAQRLASEDAVTSLPRLVWTSGTACMLLAAFIFSLSALAVKLTGGRVPVLQITLIRSTLSWVVSAVAIKARGIQPMFGQRQHVRWMVARGVTGALAMISFYVAILMLPLADAMTLFFLNPCMTAVAAWALRGEPLGLMGVTGCACSLVGLVVLTHPPMLFGGHEDWGRRRVLGTLMGVTSAVWATGAFISIRFIGKAEPAIVVALYFHTSTMLLSVVPLLIGWPGHAVWVGLFDATMLLAVAVTSFTGQLFLTRGFQLETAGKAAGLNFSQVLYSYMFGILFFHEHLTVFGVTGTALIAVGMGCVASRNTAQQPQDMSDIARDAAGGGMGSGIFNSSQQQETRSDSRSFVARLESFQQLLGRARSGLLTPGWYAAGGGGDADTDCLLKVEEQLTWQQRYSSTGGNGIGKVLQTNLPGRHTTLPPAVAVQHQSLEQQQQQQQHRRPASSSGASAVSGSGAGTAVLLGSMCQTPQPQQRSAPVVFDEILHSGDQFKTSDGKLHDREQGLDRHALFDVP